MATTKEAKRRALERLSGDDGHHVLRLRDGRVYEGWILDVGERSLRFMHAPSPFYAQATGTGALSPADEDVPLQDVPLQDVVAWLDAERGWIDGT